MTNLAANVTADFGTAHAAVAGEEEADFVEDAEEVNHQKHSKALLVDGWKC
jgi:hypothetical protein